MVFENVNSRLIEGMERLIQTLTSFGTICMGIVVPSRYLKVCHCANFVGILPRKMCDKCVNMRDFRFGFEGVFFTPAGCKPISNRLYHFWKVSYFQSVGLLNDSTVNDYIGLDVMIILTHILIVSLSTLSLCSWPILQSRAGSNNSFHIISLSRQTH